MNKGQQKVALFRYDQFKKKWVPFTGSTVPDGHVQVDVRNNMALDIARGLEPGMVPELKFGKNPAVGTTAEDIWDGGGVYPFYPTAAVPLEIFSATTGDEGLDIRVHGLDGTGVLQDEVVTLNASDATTPVALTKNYWRVHRATNISSSDLTDTLTIQASATGSGVTDGDDVAQILVGFNQTNMALYTIPVGKTGYLFDFYASTDKTTGAPKSIDIDLQFRANSSVSAGEVFRVLNHQGLVITGSSHFAHPFTFPLKAPALTDIRVQGTSDAGTTDIHAGFDMVLIDD